MINGKMPEISQEQVNKACFLLILGMLSTGAQEMKVVQEKFHGPPDSNLGDFEIVVRKIK